MTKKVTKEFTIADKCKDVFQQTAEAIGGDVMQACREAGVPAVVTRECCYDYLTTYGGIYAEDVNEALDQLAYDEYDKYLDLCGVPRTWS